jgi:hypothetical protein
MVANANALSYRLEGKKGHFLLFGGFDTWAIIPVFTHDDFKQLGAKIIHS